MVLQVVTPRDHLISHDTAATIVLSPLDVAQLAIDIGYLLLSAEEKQVTSHHMDKFGRDIYKYTIGSGSGARMEESSNPIR